MPSSFERNAVLEALTIAMAAALQDAKLPRLSDREHSALVTLQTVALILDVDEVAAKASRLLAADIEAYGSRFCRDLAERVKNSCFGLSGLRNAGHF